MTLVSTSAQLTKFIRRNRICTICITIFIVVCFCASLMAPDIDDDDDDCGNFRLCMCVWMRNSIGNCVCIATPKTQYNIRYSCWSLSMSPLSLVCIVDEIGFRRDPNTCVCMSPNSVACDLQNQGGHFNLFDSHLYRCVYVCVCGVTATTWSVDVNRCAYVISSDEIMNNLFSVSNWSR